MRNSEKFMLGVTGVLALMTFSAKSRKAVGLSDDSHNPEMVDINHEKIEKLCDLLRNDTLPKVAKAEIRYSRRKAISTCDDLIYLYGVWNKEKRNDTLATAEFAKKQFDFLRPFVEAYGI